MNHVLNYNYILNSKLPRCKASGKSWVNPWWWTSTITETWQWTSLKVQVCRRRSSSMWSTSSWSKCWNNSVRWSIRLASRWRKTKAQVLNCPPKRFNGQIQSRRKQNTTSSSLLKQTLIKKVLPMDHFQLNRNLNSRPPFAIIFRTKKLLIQALHTSMHRKSPLAHILSPMRCQNRMICTCLAHQDNPWMNVWM